MKNIHTILSEYGITIPEDKKAEFDKAVAENYKTTAEHEKKVTRLTDDLAAEKKRADDAVETLKGFDGKDFDAITRDRDEWKKKHDEAVADYKRQQEDREFASALENAISEAKGKNAKAIMALLDTEKLRGSRNLDKDIKTALDALRTDSGYLFEDNGGKPQFSTNKSAPGNPGSLTREDIMKIPDRAERRSAMAKNQHLFTKGE
jgi:calcineurin-like phosphoesterase family protein